jgi:hypothetical protein
VLGPRDLFISFIVFMPNGAKNWCFTLNNYTEEDVALLDALGSELAGIKYLVYGKEVGENGTPHLQSYVSFDRRRGLAYCRSLISSRAHFEIARGSACQNAEYCKKEGDAKEFGVVPRGQGARNDLVSVVQAIKDGASKRELLDVHPQAYARAYRMCQDALLIFGKCRQWQPEVVVYWGETGTGKTRRAYEEATQGNNGSAYLHPGGGWFDGYDGEERVIFDDFGGSEFKLTYLLKLLDRYPMRVPVKGSFVQWIPKKIWITSNYGPKDWYPNAKDEHVKALFRRFSRVVRFRRMASVLNPGDDSIEEEIVIQE